MVSVGDGLKEERRDSKTSEKRFTMAMGPERSRSLHNFSLPCLKWGGQRQLRCVKDRDDDDACGGRGGGHFRAPDRRSPPTSSKVCHDYGGVLRKPLETERKRRSSSRFQPPPPSPGIRRMPAIDSDGDDGIEAVRKKLMHDLQTEVDRMKFAVLSEGGEAIEPPPAKTKASPAPEVRPWNLRTRRAVCKEPNVNGGGAGKSQRVGEENSGISPAISSYSSPAIRDDVGSGDSVGVKRPRAKFSVPLSKQEIEEDFIAITGIRPPRRPKKRPRNVQRQMDTLFPGLWLSEITPDMYKVNENPDAGKR